MAALSRSGVVGALELFDLSGFVNEVAVYLSVSYGVLYWGIYCARTDDLLYIQYNI